MRPHPETLNVGAAIKEKYPLQAGVFGYLTLGIIPLKAPEGSKLL